MKYRSLEEVGSRQHQLATYRQLIERFSRSQIETMITTGVIVRVATAVYRIVGAPITFEQRLHAAVLDSGNGIASHRSAARLWGISSTNRIEITVPRLGNARMKGAMVHRSVSIERIRAVDNIPVTNPARTLVDIAPNMTPSALARALEKAMKQELVTFVGIRNELELLRTPARKGVGIVERLLDSFDPRDETVISKFELKVIRELRRRGLPELERQYRIVADGINRYIDLAYPRWRIAIECDPRPWHTLLLSFDDDKARNSAIAALDFTLLHVTPRNFAGDIDRIERVVCSRRSRAA